MNKALFAVLLALTAAPLARAEIDYVSETECRNWIFGKQTESEAQDAINKKLKEALNKAGAKQVFHIQYGDMETWLRSKKNGNACIIGTAWFGR